MNYIYQAVEQNASVVNLALLFVLSVLFSFGFRWRNGKLGDQITTFDGRWAYTAADAFVVLEAMGENRRFYAITQLTLDLVFPFIYTGMIAVLFCLTYPDPAYLLLIPLVVLAADLGENASTAYMALTYNGSIPPIVRLSSAFTSIKWSGVVTAAVLITVKLLYNISRSLF